MKAGAICCCHWCHDTPTLLLNNVPLYFSGFIPSLTFLHTKEIHVMSSNDTTYKTVCSLLLTENSKTFMSSLFSSNLSPYSWIIYTLILMQMIIFIKTNTELWYSWFWNFGYCQDSSLCIHKNVSIQQGLWHTVRNISILSFSEMFY